MAIREIPYLVLTAFLAALPWFWIPEGFVYMAEEPNFINYEIKLETASTFWVKEGLGRSGDPANQPLLIPNAVFYRLALDIGLDPSATQKAFISFVFLSVSLSFGLFSTIFTKKSLVRCLGLLVYLFNFYFVISLGYTAKTILLVLMPALFYITVRYLQTRRFSYLLYNYIWLFSFQAVFTNLPTAVCALAIYFFALIYHLLLNQTGPLRATLKYYFILLLSAAPVLLHQGIISLPVIEKVSEEPARFAFTAIGAPLLDLFQFRGVWWEKSGHLGIDYFNLWQFYGNPVVVVLTLLGIGAIIFSVFSVTYGQARPDKIKSFFWLSFYLLGLGLASGFYFVPGFYLWLFQNVPGMIMFRETWVKFIPYAVFSFSGITMLLVDRFGERKSKKFLIALVLISLTIAVQSYPLISGTIIDSRSIGWRRRLIKIPNYWYEFSYWFQKQEAVLLPIPFGSDSFNSLYHWYGGQGDSTDALPCLLGTNVICKSLTHVDKFASVVNESIGKGNLDFISWGGVDYVLKQRALDVLGDQDKLIWQEKEVDSFINPEPVSVFGDKLFIYKVKDKYFRQKIYATNNIFIENEKKENMATNDIYYPTKTPAFLIDKLSSISPASSLPFVDFEKLNQVQYRVKISKASHPFVLVLGDNFSRGWKVYQGDAPSTGFPLVLARLRRYFSHPVVAEEFHFITNGYANGWYINKPTDGVLTITYQPNDTYSLSFTFTIYLFLATVSLCLLSILKKIIR